jgi:competence protein ComEC
VTGPCATGPGPAGLRQLSDRGVVALAAATWAGAVVALPVARVPAFVLLVMAWLGRRPVLFVLASALLASGLAARAWAGLSPPRPRVVTATVTLVSDPVSRAWGTAAEVRLGRTRLLARAAPGPTARALAERLAGERVRLEGVVVPFDARSARRLAARHLAGRLEVVALRGWSAGSRLSVLANRARRLLVEGAASVPAGQRALFTGLVIGDDRAQTAASRDAFRAAGLSHLLAVSGGNVAFVLALAGPLLRRLSLGGRLVGGLAVLALFGVLTRWEPSVLRAEAMAAAAMVAAWRGRPQSGLRLLAVAVWGLILVDPLLVRSVGFQLSVAASAGIAVLARPLAARIPGPRPVADVLAVTAAAQAGVAPVLVPVFGPVPLASLPANLLAAPAAGVVMGWGLAAGLAAGLLAGPADGRVAWLLHRPTVVLVAWIDHVARAGAAAPLPRLGLPALGAAGVVVAAALGGVRRLRRAGRARGRGPPTVG